MQRIFCSPAAVADRSKLGNTNPPALVHNRNN